MLQLRSYIRFVVVLLLLLGARTALAQSGRIQGQVTDEQGAVVPGAGVQIVSQDSTLKRQTTTDASGGYSVSYLPAGNYQVLIQAKGFGSATSHDVTLAADQQFVFNVRLTLATVQNETNVAATIDTTQVDLTSATMSTNLSGREVSSYGLNGRNFSQLITLAPGVSNQTGQDEAKVGVAGSAKFSVNGGRVEYNTFEVDGSDVLNTSINASRGQGEPLMVYPSIDAIQEMRVLTSEYSAVYGKSASGSVLVTTKSGAAQLHGSVYEFLRNEMFNARNYFAASGSTPLYRRQDFGATIGGPIFIPNHYNINKSKSFFFYSEEMRLERTPVEYRQAVPTMAERGQGTAAVPGMTGLAGVGDFTDLCGTLVPNQGTVGATADCPSSPNGNYPLVNINYTAAAIMNTGIIPEPNSVLGCNTSNPNPNGSCYIASVSPRTYWREELFRIDHYIRPTQQLSLRFIHDAWDTTTLTPQWGIVQNSFPTVENKLTGPGLDVVLALTETLPHGFLNRLSFAYSVEHITLAPRLGQGLTTMQRPGILDDPSSLPGGGPVAGSPNCIDQFGPNPAYGGTPQSLVECPMGHIFDNGFGGGKLPGLVFAGTNGAYGGHGFAVDTGFAPWSQSNPTYDLRDDASKTVGHHDLQFGVEATIVQQNELSAVSGANSGDPQGLMTFSNQGSAHTSGNAFVDFLSGPGIAGFENGGPVGCNSTSYCQTNIKTYTQDSGQRRYYNRYSITDLYLQDDWHITPHLTLNGGVRASLFGVWHNPKGTAYNWLPSAYDPSLGNSVYVDSHFGNVVRKSGIPLPLDLNNLDPVITNGLVQCGGNSSTPSSCMQNNLFHPAPRVGFSWDPVGDGKTAIRGGYGFFWEHGTGYEANTGSLIGSAPLVLSETQSNVPFANTGSSNGTVSAYNAIGLSCQGGPAQCGNIPVPTGGATFPLNVTSIPTKAVYSYTQQWSISIQRELHHSAVGQIAYVGTKGTHLTTVSDLNQLKPVPDGLNPFAPGQPITSGVCNSGLTGVFSTGGENLTNGTGPVLGNSPGIGSTSPGYVNMLVACAGNPGFSQGISADYVRPFPGFSNIIGVRNNGDSKYHALQATFRETTRPFTLGIAYTYSHSIDDSSDRSSANFANSLDLTSNRASSDFDQRHMLNVSYIYELPLLKVLHGFITLVGRGTDEDDAKQPTAGQVYTNGQFSRLVTNLLGGWELSGITTYQTGTPFSIINGGSTQAVSSATLGSVQSGSIHLLAVSGADNAGVGNGLGIGSYADKVGNPHGGKPHAAVNSTTAYSFGPLLYNPGAYAAPRGLTFGNSGRNSLTNPTRTNFNMSLLKTFKTSDRLNFELRIEAYNVFNHTQFRIYDPSNPGNTGNNVINCYGPQPSGYSAGFGGDASAPSCLTGNSFLHPVDAHDPRILQFGLKMFF